MSLARRRNAKTFSAKPPKGERPDGKIVLNGLQGRRSEGVSGNPRVSRVECNRQEATAMSEQREPESFFPSGAIASFVAMIVFYVGFWAALYLLMAHRG